MKESIVRSVRSMATTSPQHSHSKSQATASTNLSCQTRSQASSLYDTVAGLLHCLVLAAPPSFPDALAFGVETIIKSTIDQNERNRHQQQQTTMSGEEDPPRERERDGRGSK
jgi:hypothetical protein